MRLRDVDLGDVDAYVRMRCDPAMTAELGGPQPRDGIEDKVRRDAEEAAAGTAWIKMIVPDEDRPSNGICRSLGFRLAGEQDLHYAGQIMRTNHWVIDPGAGLAWGRQGE
jgi:hypothetical protein